MKSNLSTFTTRAYSFILIGLLIRFFLATRNANNSSGFKQWLQTRVEISTPLTSWSRVLEGLYLKNIIGHSSSYEGDLVHEIPIMLKVYQLFLTIFNESTVYLLFILIDCFNAFLLYKISNKIMDYLIHLEQFDFKMGKYCRLKDKKFLLSDETLNKNVWSLFAVSIYLFSPFSLASCLAQSTIIVHNLILILWLYFLLNGQSLLSLLFLALHANITVYTIVLIFPTLSLLSQKFNYLRMKECNVLFYFKYFLGFILFTIGFFTLNLYLENFNTRFIECTYLFIFKVPDLTPNMGLFWYFLTEMFDHFIVFFTFVFQFNSFLYSIPLTIRLKENPIINILIQISLLTVLKSYPNISETSFYLALIVPVIAYLFPLLRSFLVYSCMLLVSVVLAPIMFYLWLGSGGGNANFYFAITLVYSTGQLFLIADILHSHLKREFIKINGEDCPIDTDSKDNKSAIFALE